MPAVDAVLAGQRYVSPGIFAMKVAFLKQRDHSASNDTLPKEQADYELQR